MKSTNSEVAKRVLEKLGNVAPIVRTVLDNATTAARGFFEDRESQVNSYLFPCLVRYEAKCLFEQGRYRDIGYRFVNLSQNGLLLIYEHDRCFYQIRVRKADEDGEIPTRNLSDTLRDFYNQPQPYLPSLSPDELRDTDSGTANLRLVVVWDVDDAYRLTDVSLVCPRDDTGAVHFADAIAHPVTAITADAEFDNEPEELDEIERHPLEDTGTDPQADDDNEQDD
jgi:hypothetical protein